METTTGWVTKQLFTPSEFKAIPGSFRLSSAPQKSKTLEFFDELYTYPPKFRVKWDTIDELHEDLFMSYNYRLLNSNLPFFDTLNPFFNSEKGRPIKKTSYQISSYVEGYLNKITSTRFYNGKVKLLQKALQNVPVYTILNGQGEIILANSTDSTSSKMANSNNLAYEFCGSFDPSLERSNQLGLFFMSRDDAVIYLEEIARSDTSGTKTLGLSIHCFGLDFAYRVIREYHPNVDFRFIPDLKEVQSLMTSQSTGDSTLMFGDEQQQLRWRCRPVNLIPIFPNVTKWVAPLFSFLEKTEYFKGVPIYIVNINERPSNFLSQRFHNTTNFIGKAYDSCIHYIGIAFGCGNNWVIQGSVNEQSLAPSTKTYVFFERSMATEFCKRHIRQVAHYKGNRTNFFEILPKKPKILVHNLEDFLELAEDSLATQKNSFSPPEQNLGFNFKTIQLISSRQSMLDLENFAQRNYKSPVQKASQFLDFKYRRLKGFVGVLLNTN